ncbi:hypothetical protein AMC86_PD00883 (plasmid) [Rhizobium phaseoli]|uniref:Uncharacterized protein n=1 Tax=Rhizobium phaseoli TaxID=396 RepID=A0ABM6CLM7_9HYPH|nr:hypothetical protein AMC86_PD00883 [Rhizobium phaseoli]ANL89240.1 hypothetical protein AMC81_PE00998 [Rhizobium phaseoli]ANL95749.1 hypothetical protein AMC80_PE00998 [Rhizobium phaseoli]
MLPIFVAADQFADVFAAGAIASPGDLLVDELFQVIGQGNTHSAHRAKMARLAKFGKVVGIGATFTHCVMSMSGYVQLTIERCSKIRIKLEPTGQLSGGSLR